MTEIFGVAGNPVFQSKSPLIFNTAFRELAIDAHYVRLAASTAGRDHDDRPRDRHERS